MEKFLKKYRIKLVVCLLLLNTLLGAVIIITTNSTPWNRYFEKTLYREPASTVVKASKLFKVKGKAIDLGCGVGNETAFLLNEGWRVWCVDGDPAAKNWINSRKDINDNSQLVIVESKFEEINWDSLPESQMIIAINSLPFCDSKSFPEVWNNIKEKISSGGRFVGNFFGDLYLGFTDEEKAGMTFLTKQDLLAQLNNFDIELFEEIEKDGTSATGRETYSHIFEIIIRKR